MSVKPSVFLQIKLDILQAPEGESSQTYTSTVEESNIKYVNQIPTPEYVNLEWIVRETIGAYLGL